MDWDEAEQGLRRLLNEWDPIGVADTVSDEYDCMIGPLWSVLTDGGSQAEASEFLRHEMAGHFGLDPARLGVAAVSDRLVSWWADPQPGSRRNQSCGGEHV